VPFDPDVYIFRSVEHGVLLAPGVVSAALDVAEMHWVPLLELRKHYRSRAAERSLLSDGAC